MAVTKAPSIVFFGTGPVAAQSLELLANNFTIEAVITKPRPAHHKGPTPVLEVADKLAIKTLTVSTSQDLDKLISTQSIKSHLAVLIDFGIIVSKTVIDYFPLGILNSHFSILPELRGADPITFAILSGQKQTGVSLMFIVEAMDEGPLVGYGEFDLPDTITTPELTRQLILLSDALLTHHIPRIFSGATKDGTPQSTTGRKVSYSRKLLKQDGEIDWHKPAEQLERQVRAFIGWPGSRTVLGGIQVTITKAHVTPGTGEPGQVATSDKTLSVFTAKDRLTIDMLKPDGKREMTAAAFLAGYGKKINS